MSFLLAIASLLAGCHARIEAPAAGPSDVPLQLLPADVTDFLPARLAVQIAGPERTLEALPATWDTATVELDHPTALTGPVRATLAKATDMTAVGGGYKTVAPFGLLRPATGYTLTVDLWNGGATGSLAAEQQQPLNLVGGVNSVTVTTALVPALSLTSAAPNSAAPGTSLVLQGTGFSQLLSNDVVTLGGIPAVVTAATPTQLTVTVPGLSPGTYSWSMKIGSSISTLAGFTVLGPGGTLPGWFGTPNQDAPALRFGGAEYLLAWTDTSGAPNDAVMCQIVDENGNLVGSPVQLSAPGTNCSLPAIAYDSASAKYLVAWIDNSGPTPALESLTVTNTASIASARQTLATTAVGSRPATTYDSNANVYWVAWADNGTGKSQIYRRKIGMPGQPTSGPLLVAGSANAQDNPQVSFSTGPKELGVAWEETISGATQVRAQIFASAGASIGPVFGVDGGSGLTQMTPVLSNDPKSGDFMLAWADTGLLPGIKAIRVKSTTGAPSGSVIPVGDTSAAKAVPRLVYDTGPSTFDLIWEDSRRTGFWDVYGQYATIGGVLSGSNFPVVTTSGPRGQATLACDTVKKKVLVVFLNNSQLYGLFLH